MPYTGKQEEEVVMDDKEIIASLETENNRLQALISILSNFQERTFQDFYENNKRLIDELKRFMPRQE